MTSRFSRCPFVLLLLVLVPAVRAEPPAARMTLDRHIDALFEVRTFREAALAPNGQWLAWVENVPAKDPNKPAQPALFLADLRAAAEAPRRVKTAAGGAVLDGHDLAWAPDSRRLAFLSDHGSPGQEQLYVGDVETGTAKKITAISGHLARPAFAPDGAQLAVLFIEDTPRASGPTEPAAPEVGVIGAKTWEQRLSLVHLGTGKVRPLSPADHYVYEYDWSPDSKQLVAIAAPGDGDNNWYIAKLMTLSRRHGPDANAPRSRDANRRAALVARWPDHRLYRRPDERRGRKRRRHLHHPGHRRQGAESHARSQGFRELARLAAGVGGHPVHRPR